LELVITGIFWFTIILLVHAYILYPVSLRILALFKSKPKIENQKPLPSLSILISAYNEDKIISERIENIKNLNYDFNKLELIIGSDCSSDTTNVILKKKTQDYNWMTIKILDVRRGKANVLNDLVRMARNEILVFTDANTMFEKNSLLNLVSKFSDKKVGGVCGRLELNEPKGNFDKTNREKLYWEYETHIKKMEGELGILIAANGGIYAIRKELFTKFPEHQAITDDLFQTFSILNKGYAFLYSYDAIAKEDVSKEIITEFRRKVRFAATNFQTLKYFKGLLFPQKPLVSFALWSHKLIRWFVPLLLILLFISNAIAKDFGQLYNVIFLAQVLFYASALLGYLFKLLKINVAFFSIIYYYVVTNIALLIGLIRFLSKKQASIWQSTPR
jgi:poly-beta-1,6-N-acetyl-D-glucosamine synthase